MKVIEVIEEDEYINILPNAATIGCFDGVHTGHRFLIRQVKKAAEERGLKTALITFPVHPRQVMQSDYKPQLLSCLQQKRDLISEINDADYCIMMPFTRELSMLTAKEYMKLLKDRYNVRALVIGYDHRFGHNRCETFEDYCIYGKELGIDIIKAEALIYSLEGTEYLGTGNPDDAANVTNNANISISSSSIRKLLKSGNVVMANKFLGYRYYLDGTVVGGYRVGRKIGFPTANLLPSCPDKLIPAEGVYAVFAYINNCRFKGMLNIGHRPTVNNGTDLSIEVHIINFNDDIYNKKIRIELVKRIREEKRFGSLDELIKQLHADRDIISDILDIQDK